MKYFGVETIVKDRLNEGVVHKRSIPVLSIIVPCYNEQEIFDYSLKKLHSLLENLIKRNLISERSHLLFVDDGSKDDTWNLIYNASKSFERVIGIKLSRNKGHQVALLAGLSESISDVTISIDADLQDDTSVIEEMIKHYLDGSDVVYGVRNDRKSDSFFKRKTAGLFYRIMKWMGVEQIPHHADFRLLSKRAKDALLSYKEQSLYLRGLVPLVGFQSSQVEYSRSARTAGESKYPLSKMLSLAISGITSLTVTPLRIIAALGFVISGISVLAALYALYEKICGNTVEGWASVMIAIIFLGGVQMLSLGIIGEYIGKIYLESKKRPKYFVEEKIDE
ncbi:glycosyltransferase family 2 protein [Pantoea sp. SO10]|uniref:glycosyltransferase family 2 protein n=1 Tax=Pantoea sp. SO10 TaxID=2575375 RepID=UPI0010C9D0C8|nr:glycosyltransferase family 2 protein [Pantoea sp. SO10]QCP60135.1 glycosyltransferase family 2 protein [Pantoea sp. SO10]